MAINNTVTLTGNMGGEARVHESEKGKLFAAFSLATRDSYKDKEGQWQQKDVVWHSVLTFNPTLVQMAKSFKKGARLEINGSLSYKEIPKRMKGGKTFKLRDASVIAHKIEASPLPLAKKSPQP